MDVFLRIDGVPISCHPTKDDLISPRDYFMCLSKYKNNIYSQAGEDGIINILMDKNIFDNQWCCEFGAWDGKRFSNTFNLIKNHNWHGIMIEADKIKFEALLKTQKEFPDRIIAKNYIVGYANEERSEGKKLDDILDEVGAPLDIDLISFDTDGPDYHIWKSLNKYRPKIVIIEHSGLNAYIIQKFGKIHKKDMDGTSSFWPIKELGDSKGYELLVDTGNMIFADKNVLNRRSK